MSNTLVALVSGGSSGIGLEVVRGLSAAGCLVFEMSRREQGPDIPNVMHIRADVTDEDRVKQAVDEIAAAEGSVDILVNCAGFGISGAFEFNSDAEARRQIEVNVFGMANLIRAAVPHMRRQGWGRIVNVSSVAAETPIPFQSWYSASKAAINSLTMALANELKPFGIGVCAVMPGDIRTGFTAARRKETAGDDIYQGAISRSVAKMEHDEQNGMEPRVVAHLVCRLCLQRKVRPLYTVGALYKFFVFLARVLPKALVNLILGKMYA